MASTYVNDLRLNEMATGDESGNWGVVTNLNLELIGEALGYGTEAITTNADTHTTTVADGATDPGRAMYIEYTGTLDSACTITIAPNTLNRMHFIENGTSGSQNIIISQGSGANITIPPGDTKAVYLDGAGSGAAVVDAFASLSVVDLKVQDDLTVTDDATIGGTLGVTGIVTLTDDLIIGDGKTIGSASDVDAITIAANGQLTLTQTLIGTALDISGDIDVDGTANLDIVDIDGAVDMASTLQVDGAITSSAGATITLADNGIALNLISTDADANEGPGMVFYRNSSSPADNDALGQIYLQGENDADQKVTYSIIEAFIDDASDGSEDGILRFSSMVAGTSRNRFDIIPAETVFNEDSVDVDFRVESNGNANMLFVNAGTDRIGIGVNDPTDALEIRGNLGISASGTGSKVLAFRSGDTLSAFIEKNGDNMDVFNADAGRLGFATNNGEKMRIASSGNVGIGSTDPSTKLQVVGTATDESVGFFYSNASTSSSCLRVLQDGAGASGPALLVRNDGSGNAVTVDDGSDGNTVFAISAIGSTLFQDGSATQPSIGNIGDTNTGIFFGSADNINFSCGGTSRAFLSASQFNVTGNGVFSGSISKGSGSFKIDHPLEAKKDTHHLVHSFVEAPQADNIYRGTATLSSGTATINLDTVSGMTEGTYVLLNTNTSCFTSNETDWDAVKGSVSGNILTINCQNSSSTATVSWLVIGERHDQHMKDTEWTDDNGKVIVEPLKEG